MSWLLSKCNSTHFEHGFVIFQLVKFQIKQFSMDFSSGVSFNHKCD